MNASQIRVERAGDAAQVRALLEAAFAGSAEADLVEALRAEGDLFLALVDERAGVLAGYAAFPRLDLELDGRTVPVAGLAPVAVMPALQRRGIGAALIRDGLARLKDRGERLVFVLGDPAYYARFGFRPAGRFVSRYAGPYFQVLPLAPDAPAAGRISYPDAFAAL